MEIYGMDEVGRGCLAGPMLACSVPQSSLALVPDKLRPLIKDSKHTSKIRRHLLASYFLKNSLPFRVACITVSELNDHGLAWAQTEIFHRLVVPKAIHFIDGNFRLGSLYSQYSISLKKADTFHSLVSLASILAKYFRDQYMDHLDREYPEYGFSRHKGYGTLAHRQAIQKYGPSPMHRLSFLKLTVHRPGSKIKL